MKMRLAQIDIRELLGIQEAYKILANEGITLDPMTFKKYLQKMEEYSFDNVKLIVDGQDEYEVASQFKVIDTRLIVGRSEVDFGDAESIQFYSPKLSAGYVIDVFINKEDKQRAQIVVESSI